MSEYTMEGQEAAAGQYIIGRICKGAEKDPKKANRLYVRFLGHQEGFPGAGSQLEGRWCPIDMGDSFMRGAKLESPATGCFEGRQVRISWRGGEPCVVGFHRENQLTKTDGKSVHPPNDDDAVAGQAYQLTGDSTHTTEPV